MRVVADTTPLNYLILIEQADILSELFDVLSIPSAVVSELKHPEAPLAVRQWIAKPPKWLQVRIVRRIDPALDYLGAGEREAIALALARDADALLIGERIGRREARRRNLDVVGTLAVLDEAGHRGLLDFEDALDRLRQTNFRLSPALLKALAHQRRSR